MELGWGALALIIIAAGAAWFWQDSLGARELANAAAMRACEEMGLQFLDGTVAFARIVIARSAQGLLTLRRTYVFDYTANSIERRQGFVVLGGHRVESVGYAPDTVVERRRPESALIRPLPPAMEAPRKSLPQSPPDDEQRADPDDASTNGDNESRVLRLDDWRARKRSGDRQR